MPTDRITYHDPITTTFVRLGGLRGRIGASPPSEALERRAGAPAQLPPWRVALGPVLLVLTVTAMLLLGRLYLGALREPAVPERVRTWLAVQPLDVLGDRTGYLSVSEECHMGAGPVRDGPSGALRVGRWSFNDSQGRHRGLGAFDTVGSGGVWIWDDAAQPKEFLLYRHGELLEQQHYRRDGSLAMVIACDRGMRHGRARYFDERGICILEGSYHYGVRQGEWLRRHADGSCERLTYDEDRLVARNREG